MTSAEAAENEFFVVSLIEDQPETGTLSANSPWPKTRDDGVFNGFRLKIGDLGASVFRDKNNFEMDQNRNLLLYGRISQAIEHSDQNQVPTFNRLVISHLCK